MQCWAGRSLWAYQALSLGSLDALAGQRSGLFQGGLYGAIAAESAESVETVTAMIRDRLTESEIQRKVQGKVRDLVKTGATMHQVASDESITATSLEAEVISIVLDGLPPPTYSTLGVINPPLRLVVAAEVRLRSDLEGALYTSRFEYWGAKMTVSEWASNDAQPVGDEIERATTSLAEQIVDGVFLVHRFR